MWLSEERACQPGNSECSHLKHKHAWHAQGRTKRPVWLEDSEQEVKTRGTQKLIGRISAGQIVQGLICHCDGFHVKPSKS